MIGHSLFPFPIGQRKKMKLESVFCEGREYLPQKDEILQQLGDEEKQNQFYTRVFESELETDYPLGVVKIKARFFVDFFKLS